MREGTGSRGNEDGQTLSRCGDILILRDHYTYTTSRVLCLIALSSRRSSDVLLQTYRERMPRRSIKLPSQTRCERPRPVTSKLPAPRSTSPSLVVDRA